MHSSIFTLHCPGDDGDAMCNAYHFFSNVIEYNWCHRFMQNRKELTYRCYKTTKGVFLESGSICGLKLQTFVLLNNSSRR